MVVFTELLEGPKNLILEKNTIQCRLMANLWCQLPTQET